jgi:hypothetical protein
MGRVLSRAFQGQVGAWGLHLELCASLLSVKTIIKNATGAGGGGSLDYIVRPCLKPKPNKNQQKSQEVKRLP